MKIRPVFDTCARGALYTGLATGAIAGALVFAKVTADAGIKTAQVIGQQLDQLVHPK